MKNVLEGKYVTDIANSEGGYNYYGFVDTYGQWAIMRAKTDNTEFRYAIGGSNYSTAWTNRATQNYSVVKIN